jgi:chromosome segregation ATPase
MTVALEEFTEWRHSVEARLGKLEDVSEKHAERFNQNEHLLGAMDRDLGSLQAEFRAQRGMLQALHLTQSDHSRSLGKLEVGVQRLDLKVQALDTRVLRLEEGMQKVEAGVQTIIGLLTSADDEDSVGNSRG